MVMTRVSQVSAVSASTSLSECRAVATSTPPRGASTTAGHRTPLAPSADDTALSQPHQLRSQLTSSLTLMTSLLMTSGRRLSQNQKLSLSTHSPTAVISSSTLTTKVASSPGSSAPHRSAAAGDWKTPNRKKGWGSTCRHTTYMQSFNFRSIALCERGRNMGRGIPPQPTRGSQGASYAPPAGSAMGWNPGRKWIWCTLSSKEHI